MAWKDLQARIMRLLSGKDEKTSRRPDGGTSCYRPVQRRNRQEEELARQKAEEYAASQPPIAYAHTGFTGMNPPMTGKGPVQSTISGDPYGYGQGAAPADPYGYGQGAAPAGPYGYSQNAVGADPYGYGAAQAAVQEARAGYAGQQPAGQPPQREGRWFTGSQRAQRENGPGGAQQPSGQYQSAGNISYMPGVATPEGGSSFTHVEHIMAITSLRSCYEAIECMKNGETLIVTLDVLGSEGERIRCQDMLAGAAFTLQCTVRTLDSIGVIVIAPPGVKMLPEQRTRRYEEPQPVPAQEQAWPGAQESPRRERRVSQNAVGWENAGRPGTGGFNPYTGSMPAAAGSYGVYGGY